MTADIQLLARVLAFESGHAVPIASHRRVAIRPQALIVCPIAMAGEDTTIHTVAIGTLGASPTVLTVPDPRDRDAQFRLFADFGRHLTLAFEHCRAAGDFPQIIVPSVAAADHLDILADRWRFNRDDAVVRHVGELLAYATERYPIAGQLALLPATTILGMHFATGQTPSDDAHLGALLAWLDPPSGTSVHSAVAEAEETPMGIHTDPEWDRDVLAPLVTQYNRARRAGATDAQLVPLSTAIDDALAPVARHIYTATQRAIALLLSRNLPPLPALPNLLAREEDAFRSFMDSRDAGYPLPIRDKAKAAVFKLREREDAAETMDAALLLGDRMAGAQAYLDGRIVAGTVENPAMARVAPRRFNYSFDLVSDQQTLHLRARDTLYWSADSRLKVSVTSVQRTGGITRISLQIVSGQVSIGLPSVGSTLTLVPAVPDWQWLWTERGQLKRRLATTPWTHTNGYTPLREERAGKPCDLLAAVESLR